MTLSIIRGTGDPGDKTRAVGLASPFFTLSFTDTELTFEVFERDATGLRDVLHQDALFYLDEELFWGRLETLEPRESTHQGLALMRDRPVLWGRFAVFGDSPKHNA